jgi:hypothetical protein
VRRLALALAALGLLAAALPAPAAAARCPDVIDTGPTGFDPADSDAIRTRGVGCDLARHVLVHSDPYPPGWRGIGRDPFDGRWHVARNNPRKRIAYR